MRREASALAAAEQHRGLGMLRSGERRRVLLQALAWAVAVIGGTFIATAYGPPWNAINGGGTTATGIELPQDPTGNVGPPYIVAVDPSVIPLHSKLLISPNPTGNDATVWSAEDTGGAIQGNRIDFLDLAGRASQDGWGRRPVKVALATGTNATTAQATAGAGAGTASVDNTTGSTGSSSTSGSPSPWLKLLLDITFIGIGAAAIYKGSKRALAGGGG